MERDRLTESTQPDDKAIADFVRRLFDDHDNRHLETMREAEKTKKDQGDQT